MALGLAATDPATRADRMDGAAPSSEDGPLMLIAEGDVRPALRQDDHLDQVDFIAAAAWQ